MMIMLGCMATLVYISKTDSSLNPKAMSALAKLKNLCHCNSLYNTISTALPDVTALINYQHIRQSPKWVVKGIFVQVKGSQ